MMWQLSGSSPTDDRAVCVCVCVCVGGLKCYKMKKWQWNCLLTKLVQQTITNKQTGGLCQLPDSPPSSSIQAYHLYLCHLHTHTHTHTHTHLSNISFLFFVTTMLVYLLVLLHINIKLWTPRGRVCLKNLYWKKELPGTKKLFKDLGCSCCLWQCDEFWQLIWD